MSYEEIVAEVAKSTGMSEKIVDRTYKAYWRAVREHIVSLPLKEDITLEELQPNVNIPSIGKFYINPARFKKMKEDFNKYKN